MTENYYKTLEVSETASIDEIRKSYRRLSMLYHPDKNKNNPESTAKFQKISEAYETLGDSDKKREYDAQRSNPFANINMRSGGVNPVDELFANLFGMPFGQAIPPNFGKGSSNFGNGQTTFRKWTSNLDGFDGEIPNFEGGPFFRVFHNGIQKPVPIIKNVSIPIDKILTGTTVPIEIERWILQDEIKVFEKETMYVTLEKGMDEGEIIILREKGNVISDTCKGDIKISIKIDNPTEFKRSGLDLILEKTISLKEALCGFDFEMKYITGKIYNIHNKPGNIIYQGYRKTINGLGFTRDQHVGNLVIIFNVRFPERLSDETINQIKEINF